METRIKSYRAVASPIRVYVLSSLLEVWIKESDTESSKVMCDALISNMEAFRYSYWRLRNDPINKRRYSYKLQRWL